MSHLARSDVIDAPYMHDGAPASPLSGASSPVLASPISGPYSAFTSSVPSSQGVPRPEKSGKKTNPLIDLIETEVQYVDLLAHIIRRVAGAWSKDNFPPAELDTVFRGIEGVYKANRALLSRLKDIGPNPTSPKALGDLLMRWIDDLEEPYTRYCSAYVTGFDTWTAVQSNPRLATMLSEVSTATPPSQSGSSSADTRWTLDSLFLLPRGRLKYYRRLYTRLLKSTQPGRSDHRLLVGAVERLDHLLELVGSRLDISLSSGPMPPPAAQASTLDLDAERLHMPPWTHQPGLTDDSTSHPIPDLPGGFPTRANVLSSPVDMSRYDSGTLKSSQIVERALPPKPPDSLVEASTPPQMSSRDIPPSSPPTRVEPSRPASGWRSPSQTPAADSSEPRQSEPYVADRSSRDAPRGILPSHHAFVDQGGDRGSASSATLGSTQSEDRSSRGTASTSTGSLSGLPTAKELERKLSVDRVYDIFTMKPKTCSLQMNPPGLSFVRSTRASADVRVTCIPVSTGVEAVTSRGHVFLMSDLVLICEKMTEEERSETASDGPSMWLSYPPLAGRFIRILHGASQDDTVLVVQVLKKVTIAFGTESLQARDRLQKDLEDCIALARSVPTTLKARTSGPVSAMSNHPTVKEGPNLPRSSSEPLSPPPDVLQLDPVPNGFSRNVPAGPGSKQFVNSHLQTDSAPSLPPKSGIMPLRTRSASPSSMNTQPVLTSTGSFGAAVPPRPYNMGISRSTPDLVEVRPPPHGPSVTHNGAPLPIPQNSSQFYSQAPRLVAGPSQLPMRDASIQPSFAARAMHEQGFKDAPPERSFGQGPGPGLRSREEAFVPPLPGYPLGPSSLAAAGPFTSPDMLPRGRVESGPFSSPTSSAFLPPSARSTVLSSRSASLASSHPSSRRPLQDVSPPSSPTGDERPTTSVISAQMKCKVFLKQAHAQWKSLGSAKLKLYHQQPTNVKQLVVEADTKEKTLLISTIVLTDAVERVGKTGVAIELSDKGASTGIVYLIQLRNESSATGLFDSLLAGSDRTTLGKP